jgi:Xaa-Pro aminopeptidase
MADLLPSVRALLREHGLAAYFCPNNDSHNSEYLADYDKRMPFLSGFKGSNGQMLITEDTALLWTDGRYWLAAEKELFEGWRLMKMKRGEPTYFEWITQNLPAGSIIGYDPFLLPSNAATARSKYFEEKGFTFKALEENLINQVWTARPPFPSNAVFEHPEAFAGESVDSKVSRVGQQLSSKYLFTGVLDEIAWVLNLRGNDIEYNPVFFAYLLIEKAEPKPHLHLFIEASKVEGVASFLEANSVVLHPYQEVTQFLAALDEEVTTDGDECSQGLYKLIKQAKSGAGIISNLKSVKSGREVEGMRHCHIEDGIAVVRYLAWLKRELDEGRDWNEYTAALELAKFRAQGQNFVGLSFETISATGANAAVIHYAPDEASASKLSKDSIYLLDSGGQYWDGTTDITRTVHYGVPTDAEQDANTRVLLGNLDLERLIWPASSQLHGGDMDILARRRLWEVGYDYNHGTGHGVGYFLNVHEGPQSMSKYSKVVLKPGMNVTDEPGYYEAGAFGIRIENVLFVVERGSSYAFENVTIAPYDRSLIKQSLLNESDFAYIDAYHGKVWALLSHRLEALGDSYALEYLREQTRPLRA